MSTDKFSDEFLAARMRELLDAQGYSIRQAAEVIDMSYRTLQNQLNGTNKMSASTFTKLLEFLDIPISFVTHGRINLKRKSLANALESVMQEAIPILDADLNVSIPQSPDSRTKEERSHMANVLAFAVVELYEKNVIYSSGLEKESYNYGDYDLGSQ